MREKTRKLFNDFNQKYGVNIDTSYFEACVTDISKSIKANLETPSKANNEKLGNVCREKYNMAFDTMFYRIFLEKVNTDKANANYNEDLSVGKMSCEFDELMKKAIHTETGIFNFTPPSTFTFGSYFKDEEKRNQLFYEQSKLRVNGYIYNAVDTLNDNYKNVSTKDLCNELKQKYTKDGEESYEAHVSAVQFLKKKVESRGFFDKLFHPIDTYRERKACETLAIALKERFGSEKTNEEMLNDIENEHFRTPQVEDMIQSFAKINNKILDATYDETNFNKEFYKELEDEKIALKEQAQREKEEEEKIFEEKYSQYRDIVKNAKFKDIPEEDQKYIPEIQDRIAEEESNRREVEKENEKQNNENQDKKEPIEVDLGEENPAYETDEDIENGPAINIDELTNEK